ncbi:Nonribosomal peptide synthetase 2 [Sphaceloma murrayae]|uniref:Nonribosomal peptide synthetase 2 n=1 Tax=Sphaceloma murrayae TaxID=2082308 RepID=A0A2K1QFN7_9PEZI|nr:Nonribosomal peptide synthetase 2 [Sphaceloma murrayae]
MSQNTSSPGAYPSIRLPHPYLTQYKVESSASVDGARLSLLLDQQPSAGRPLPQPLHTPSLTWIELESRHREDCPPLSDNSAWARAVRSPGTAFEWMDDAPPTLGQIWNVVHAIYLGHPTCEYFRLALSGAGNDVLKAELLATGLGVSHPKPRNLVQGTVEASAELLILRSAFWQGAASPVGPRPIWVVGDGTDGPLRHDLSSFPIMPEVQHFTNKFPMEPVYTQHPVRRTKPAPGSIVYSRWVPEIGQHFSLEAVNWEDGDHLELFNTWQNDPRVAKGWNETGTLEEHREYLRKLHFDPHVLCLFGRFDETRFAYFELYWSKEDHYGAHYNAGDYDRGRHSLVGDESFRGSHRVNAWYSSCIHYCFLDDPRTGNVVGEPKATGAIILSYENAQGLTIGNDLDEIWRWNALFPHASDICMHEIVSQQAKIDPESLAISSWDGDLSYGDVEDYSDRLARSLAQQGVRLHDVVGLCFEKTRWTIIAVLAAMKSGATFVMMDPTLPLSRLQNIAQQANTRLILTSQSQTSLAETIVPGGDIMQVGEGLVSGCVNILPAITLPSVPRSALMYIIFTSGSTGLPKGVKISHGTYASSASPRAKAVGYDKTWRVLDFASYAFDVSIDSMLLTLANGGCLCIPSDEDRMNDINGVIRKMRINYAGITPSVARILDLDVIASLEALGLGGEAASARDVNAWGQHTRIVIGYGPCECTIGCTVNSSAASGNDYITIGQGNGANIWIVDPDDHNALMPMGAVGELLVEGPIVGQGYLNDPEKTALSFIEDPPWLTAGHKGHKGRAGRLYKTGDLGHYDQNGTAEIVFAGRKDTQVKLRGQRVELGEIESQLISCLPQAIDVIVEVVTTLGSGDQSTLVAFYAPHRSGHGRDDPISLVAADGIHQAHMASADSHIRATLPRYMIPSAYIGINHIPVLISGKTDRKQLRHFATTVDLRRFDKEGATSTAEDFTDRELSIRQAWMEVLHTDASAIAKHSHFFALGGDSLTAMKLVSACRSVGLTINVATVFENPKLGDMAAAAQIWETEVFQDVEPFSMISKEPNDARKQAATLLELEASVIEDIYPCTPTQESLFTFSLKSKDPYIAQRIVLIPAQIGVERWKEAWDRVVDGCSMLRTRVAQVQEPGLQQIVVRQGIGWRSGTSLKAYLVEDRNTKMELGQPLARYAIIHDENGVDHMVWTVHHVLYDGWSEPLILDRLRRVLNRQHVPDVGQLKHFVKLISDIDEEEGRRFWAEQLRGAVGPQFPLRPHRDYVPQSKGLARRMIPVEALSSPCFTAATIIRGAWALVASQYTDSDDVVFGETVTGRDVALPTVESIVGPLIATVPVRIKIDRSTTADCYLEGVQRGLTARTRYQHMGMQNIRKVSNDAQHACETGVGLVVQPDSDYDLASLGFEAGDPALEALHFNPYALMLACRMGKTGMTVHAGFDEDLISAPHMERILAQLEVACSQLTADLSRKVGDVSCLPVAELERIWRWHPQAPLTLNNATGTLHAAGIFPPGSHYPPATVPWVCTLASPHRLAPIDCPGELWLESAIPLGQGISAPAWLNAGSSSVRGPRERIYPTGDIVQIDENGVITFLRRRQDTIRIEGHAVDIVELEDRLKHQLPTGVRVSIAVDKSRTNADSHTEPRLLALVEQETVDTDTIEIFPPNSEKCRLDFVNAGSSLSLRTSISKDLALALKRLDRFANDSLLPFMAPFAYLLVNRAPVEYDSMDPEKQAESNLSDTVLLQYREGLRRLWASLEEQISSTDAETILRSAWKQILGLDLQSIDVQDNFFRLGGDSVLAMKLVSLLRSQGHGLGVADIFQHMRLGDAAKVLRIGQMQKSVTYQTFSTLRHGVTEQDASETVRSQLTEKTWVIEDIYPVTDSQSLDIRATVSQPRTSLQYTMLYFDGAIDHSRLERACAELVKRHSILRTVFVEDGQSFLGVVLNSLDIEIARHSVDTDLKDFVSKLCTSDAAGGFPLGRPFLRFHLVKSAGTASCLALGLSHAQYDGVSLPRLLRDLELLYSGGQLQRADVFASYVARTQEESTQREAIAYWRKTLDTSLMSEIPLLSRNIADKSVFKTRPVDTSLRPTDVTLANVLCAAWSLVLARRLNIQDVTFGNITSGRTFGIADLTNTVGPCYQFTPVRVVVSPHRTTRDLLHDVQNQIIESSKYDFLGFDKIKKECARWSEDVHFFDSVVHHQDAEDFDTMTFAGMECGVDILNPDGDAAWPLKVVSFVKDGTTHAGIVGSARDESLIDILLGELVDAVTDLAGEHSVQQQSPLSMAPRAAT